MIDPIDSKKRIQPTVSVDLPSIIVPPTTREIVPLGVGAFPDSISTSSSVNMFSSEAIRKTHPQRPAQYYALSIISGQDDLLTIHVKIEKEQMERFQESIKELDTKLREQGLKLAKKQITANAFHIAGDTITLIGHGVTLVFGLAALSAVVPSTAAVGISLTATSIGTMPLISAIGAFTCAGIGFSHFVLQKSGVMHKAVELLPFEENTQDRIETIANSTISAVSLLGSIGFSGMGYFSKAAVKGTFSTIKGVEKSVQTVASVVQAGASGVKRTTDARVSKSEGDIQTLQAERENYRRSCQDGRNVVTRALEKQERDQSLAKTLIEIQRRLHAISQQS